MNEYERGKLAGQFEACTEITQGFIQLMTSGLPLTNKLLVDVLEGYSNKVLAAKAKLDEEIEKDNDDAS